MKRGNSTKYMLEKNLSQHKDEMKKKKKGPAHKSR